MTTKQFIAQLPSSDSNFHNKYGINPHDQSITEGITFKHGFGDLDFPWHFPAALANEVADYMVDQGKLTQEQKDDFSLHDWANIIGSGWFSRLCHLMALTTNGQYGQIGNYVDDYAKKSLYRKLETNGIITSGDPLFDYGEQYEPYENLAYATATLSKPAIRGLRQKMKKDGDSVGCPVARHSVLLPKDLVVTNAHVERLIDRGTLHRVEERSTDDSIRFTQEWSAIDKSLAFFAWQLDQYAERFGTPSVVTDENRINVIHSFKKPVEVLRWRAEDRPSEQTGLGAVATDSVVNRASVED